jgi:hypothetical protein
LQVGCDLIAGAMAAFDKINLNRLDLFEKFFVDGKRNSVFPKNFIFREWFIQNHAQRGPGSASLGEHDADRWSLISLFEVILHHYGGLLGYLKHSFLLKKAFAPLPKTFIIIANPASKPKGKILLKIQNMVVRYIAEKLALKYFLTGLVGDFAPDLFLFALRMGYAGLRG